MCAHTRAPCASSSISAHVRSRACDTAGTLARDLSASRAPTYPTLSAIYRAARPRAVRSRAAPSIADDAESMNRPRHHRRRDPDTSREIEISRITHPPKLGARSCPGFLRVTGERVFTFSCPGFMHVCVRMCVCVRMRACVCVSPLETRGTKTIKIKSRFVPRARTCSYKNKDVINLIDARSVRRKSDFK